MMEVLVAEVVEEGHLEEDVRTEAVQTHVTKGKRNAPRKKTVDRDFSRFQIVQYKTNVPTPFLEGKPEDAQGKAKDKGKRNGKGKAKVGKKQEDDSVLGFIHKFGSVGNVVRVDGQKKIMSAGFPLNNKHDMEEINLNVLTMMDEVNALIGDGHVDKE